MCLLLNWLIANWNGSGNMHGHEPNTDGTQMYTIWINTHGYVMIITVHFWDRIY